MGEACVGGGGSGASGANCKRPSSEPILTTCSKKTITSSMILNQLNEQENNATSSPTINPSQEITTTSINAQTTNLINNNNNNNNINSNNSTMNLDAKNMSIIQKMTLSEVVDLVMQLLTIFWSAAAGNIQLVYNSSISTSSSLNSLSTALSNYASDNNNGNFIL